MKTLNLKNRGFTLIEILVSLGVFLIIVTISLGAILGVYDANRKARSESALMGNLNLAIETMTREMRYGKNYQCGQSPPNCAGGASYISFISNLNETLSYRQNGPIIEKSVNGGAYSPMTSPEVIVESLNFFVFGATLEASPNEQQPRVQIKIKASSGTKNSTKDVFTIQTLVSQRQLDNGL